MAKHAANKGEAPLTDKNNKRKRDAQDNKHEDAPVALFAAVKDTELDDIFAKSDAFSAPVPVASTSKAHFQTTSEPAAKKGKKSPSPKVQMEEDVEVDDQSESESNSAEEEDEDEDENENEDGEDNDAELSEIDEELPDEDDEEASDAGNDDEAAKAKETKKAKKTKLGKYVPAEESVQDKNRRTAFIGNLPIDAAKSKSILKQLRAHIMSFVPSAKIESLRFRSVAFATPTAALPTEDPEKDANQRAKREKERAAAWKAKQNTDGEDAELDKAKVFIDAKGKRKVAFIKKDFHSEIDSCNAYVVFAYPHPDRAANVAPILDPFEAAAKFIASANSSTFSGRTIRVDSVRLPSSVALAGASTSLSKRDAWLPSNTDPKKSLFVGGLDYAAKEEDVRVFFEELVKAERGANKEGSGKWVTGVRIVRDKETQLGKGFGYVHFADRESVEEILAMDAKQIKFAKRTLRVQPCKTIPTANTLQNTIKKVAAGSGGGGGASSGKKDKTKRPYVRPGVIPKGNPLLGEKLKDLSKEERKTIKSSDADRQARRLAKKKAKMSLEKDKAKGAVKLTLTRSEREKTSASKKPKAKKGKKRAPSAVAKMKGSRE
ncbi:nucleolar protein 12 [Cryptococcus neoformans c8]|nr:nucleolar protein 12 [Cryptococcus neoformans var. grubii MW-RSA1955]OXG53902.1 nucleolar protein 12 [Cryptococcus neoformans var. grubii CHC193]OXG58682.1 nucleolar protein 12 [Cryptococcus neoformans var. grubii c8]OXH03691.1 nucleolar protein 12 [Cryptococcus neoformans var. grubii A5-35-17]OXH05036.1 nucleolar protein 12 [Cryptococcus neoformans var. grubii A1-35-8]